MRILIILVCVIALTATIAAIIVGSRSFEGLVVDKPYETGMAWDETRQKQANLGWTVSVQGAPFKTGMNDLIVKILSKDGSPLADAAISVTVSRPSTRAYDKTYQTVHLADGRYRASIDLLLYGNWDVTVHASRNNDRSSFKETIFVEHSAR